MEAEKTEMELANIELVARRSARLKDLYQHLNDRYSECRGVWCSDVQPSLSRNTDVLVLRTAELDSK